MDEGVKTEKKMEEIIKKEFEKDKNKQQTPAGILKGVTKINKLYANVDKQEKFLKRRQEKLHREYIKKQKKTENHLTIKTQAEIAQQAPNTNKNKEG